MFGTRHFAFRWLDVPTVHRHVSCGLSGQRTKTTDARHVVRGGVEMSELRGALYATEAGLAQTTGLAPSSEWLDSLTHDLADLISACVDASDMRAYYRPVVVSRNMGLDIVRDQCLDELLCVIALVAPTRQPQPLVAASIDHR